MDSQEKILLRIQSEEKQHGSILEQYRQAMIEMTRKYFTQKEMAEMLNKGGLKISRQAISKYLKKNPITMEELNGKTESSSKENSTNLKKWKEQNVVNKSKKNKTLFNINKAFK